MRFIMVGGFLGAGKTTTLARLGRHFMQQGLKVGLVTNDQAQDLVDTSSLRAQGFPVEEVPGACFCCRFDELVGKVDMLDASERPEVILAEPVGSCTDLVATVVQPLKDLYTGRFEVAPYAVLFKPSHGLRILRNEQGAGFSPKAAYIFRKQLEEADAILINRIDEMTSGQQEELVALVRKEYPGVPVLPLSAKAGTGFAAYTELLEQKGVFGRKILEIDYDTYAEGEAELGWLNSSVHVASGTAFSLDDFLVEIVHHLQNTFQHSGGEIAHLKAIGLWEGVFGVANLVSSATAPELSLPSDTKVPEADVIVNARVAADPALLEAEVRRVLLATCRERGLACTFHTMQSFRPGRPTPTHRYAAAVL